MKFNVTKILSVVGLALTIAGTIVSGVAGDRKTKDTLAKLVDEKLSK